MLHFPKLGLYDIRQNLYYVAYVHDDYGNLVGLTDAEFDQFIYFRTGIIHG